MTIKEARLLTYSEAIDQSIRCDENTDSCPTTGSSAFITNTTFYLGTAGSDYTMYYILSNGGFSKTNWNNSSIPGVRPVVVISKDSI